MGIFFVDQKNFLQVAWPESGLPNVNEIALFVKYFLISYQCESSKASVSLQSPAFPHYLWMLDSGKALVKQGFYLLLEWINKYYRERKKGFLL